MKQPVSRARQHDRPMNPTATNDHRGQPARAAVDHALARTLREVAASSWPAPGGSDPADLRLSVAELLRLHGNASGPVLLMLMAVLATLPVAGAGMVLSVGIFLMAYTWLRGKDAMPLPARLGRLSLNATWTRRCLHGLAWLYEQADRRLQPRWPHLSHPRLRALWGAWIALMAAIIFLPLPLGNVLPAISLVLLALGWMFRDGLALMAAGVSGLGALAYAVSLAHLVTQLAQQGWMQLTT